MIYNQLGGSRDVRIGAVSYLNTKPLVYDLPQILPSSELIFDLPSRLADQLAAGQLDIALIPSVEYFQNPEYRIVSDACIGCHGPVWSVMLLSRTPIPQIRSLALDEGSRTSVALVRTLLKQRFDLEPSLVPFEIGSAIEDCQTDAVLVIGDRAMHVNDQSFCQRWDLGEQWCNWSGLPFVFAMWVARPGMMIHNDLQTALSTARDRGLAHLAEIAAREAPAMGLAADDCLAYLRDNLHFHLGEAELRGLEMFRQQAERFAMAAPGSDSKRSY